MCVGGVGERRAGGGGEGEGGPEPGPAADLHPKRAMQACSKPPPLPHRPARLVVGFSNMDAPGAMRAQVGRDRPWEVRGH